MDRGHQSQHHPSSFLRSVVCSEKEDCEQAVDFREAALATPWDPWYQETHLSPTVPAPAHKPAPPHHWNWLFGDVDPQKTQSSREAWQEEPMKLYLGPLRLTVRMGMASLEPFCVSHPLPPSRRTMDSLEASSSEILLPSDWARPIL